MPIQSPLKRQMGSQYSHSHIDNIDKIIYGTQYSIKHERCYKPHSLKANLTNEPWKSIISILTMNY